MFRLFIIFAFLNIVLLAHSQQDANFSQYMNNSLATNPGYAASRDLICISALNRQQWYGMPGKPNTTVLSVNGPVQFLKGGVGVNIHQESAGFNKNLDFNGVYAYLMNVNDGQGKLGIGVNIGVLSKTFDPKWIYPEGNAGISDQIIPTSEDTKAKMSFDLGLGMYYRTENLYFGVSSAHLYPAKFEYSTKGEYQMTRHFYITSGYTIALPNPQFEFMPSVFLGVTKGSQVFDMNALLFYNKKVWGGISYRLSSAIIGMFGIELKNGLRIGYSYDFSASAVQKFNSGSHELSLGYSFSLEKEKIPHKYKSVRFL